MYKYIRAWCRLMRSEQYWVDSQLTVAERDGAPENSLFQRGDGSWATLDDVSHPVAETVRSIADGS